MEPAGAIAAIVPALDEARRIGGTIAAARAAGFEEIVVVDGGSGDETVAIAREAGARVIEAGRGRARQMMAGVEVARADTFVFVHADVRLPRDAAAWIRATLTEPGVVAGAFRTRTVFDGEGAPPWVARWLWLADVRGARGRVPYGDQALFVGREAFAAAGGFPDQPLLEDVALARALRRLGEVRVVPRAVTVSGRRFVARPMRMTLACHLIPLLHAVGVTPASLARLWR